MENDMDNRFAYKNLVYDGAVSKVYRVGLKMDDGKVIPRDLIHYNGAAVILPVLADGSIVLIRNQRFVAGGWLYELPAGMLEEGENPDLCAGRELAEETGYTAGSIRKLVAFFASPGNSDELIHAYLATDLRQGEQDLEVYERIKVETFSDSDVRKMVLDGTIHDAKTIAALGLYWLGKGQI
ncbi:MAG: NUDIX hydrolase [Planctomycetaceae bacterium]|nr:MAG: NUDIX hydrolase [Planctomycetaceae bacterium]